MPGKKRSKQGSPRGPWNTVEVAEITDINRITIARWVDSGKVRAPKQDPKSKEYIWNQADIDELVRYAKSKDKESHG